MKVALINTSEYTGGAAIACKRLFEAHDAQGISVNHLVLHPTEKSKAITISKGGFFSKWNLYLEKLHLWFHEKNASYRFKFSTAIIGSDISKHPALLEADVIHFHWLQQGFLSIKNIRAIVDLGKPIFWTMHDMWTFTGGCHYSEHCLNYKQGCGNCFMLKRPQVNDLSSKIWKRKEELYNQSDITFITCSSWLKDIAKSSSLLSNQKVVDIPNPIDVNFYKPSQREKGKKYTVLIQAMDLNDERKGFTYFLECLKELKKQDDNITDVIKINCFGKASDDTLRDMGFEVHAFGFLDSKEKVLSAYQSSDVLVIPSLQDNLPNAVMESLACGLPVVGFDTGGIPEMVDHEINGFITKKKDVAGLASGIKWVIEDDKRFSELSANARKKAVEQYSYQAISNKYVAQYKRKLNQSL